jgi:6-phosphogluconate dehydrogenase
MQIGMIGLGRMGGSMLERIRRGGHEVVGYDTSPEALKRSQQAGAKTVDSLQALLQEVQLPRALWLMVPSGPIVDRTIQSLLPGLGADDVIIDGGNSNYKDTLRRAEMLKNHSIHYVDVGTSGGIWGLSGGYSLMIGGEPEVVSTLTPIFQALAPAPDKGWGHVGPSGSGHFVKMVHNGIEYGLMEAFAEGFELMRRKSQFGLDMKQIAEIWRHGSVVRSWLLDLIARGLNENPTLSGIAPYVSDSGEGRWTAIEAIELGCAIPVIEAALNRRFFSQEPEPFADKLLAVMRNQFGGHPVKAKD